MGDSDKNAPQAADQPEPQQTPRSTPPTPQGAVADALAVDAMPDETRLHGDADETQAGQSTTGHPTPDQSVTEKSASDRESIEGAA